MAQVNVGSGVVLNYGEITAFVANLNKDLETAKATLGTILKNTENFSAQTMISQTSASFTETLRQLEKNVEGVFSTMYKLAQDCENFAKNVSDQDNSRSSGMKTM